MKRQSKIDKEIREWQRDHYLVKEEDLKEGLFPSLRSISMAFTHIALPIPHQPERAEFAYFNRPPRGSHEAYLAIHTWNHAWETSQLRHEVIHDKFHQELQWLKDKEKNIYLLPIERGPRYGAYGPLYHLLPAGVLKQHRLPLLRSGLWPYSLSTNPETLLPQDFNERLTRAFSTFIWPLLEDKRAQYAFSDNDPIKLLANNLDFWLPYVYEVAEEYCRQKPVTEPQEKFFEIQKSVRADAPQDFFIRPPLCGGDIWTGEDEALEAARKMVERADQGGKLRSIIDAVRSHSIQDDFSDRWSTQKADFERAFYKTRAKVTFVEIDDTIPVHGPESELHENLLWSDLASLVDPKDRRIIVLLKSGLTQVGDISKELGYKTHSPVSKALARIREKAKRLLI